jgi:hypothetical protein
LSKESSHIDIGLQHLTWSITGGGGGAVGCTAAPVETVNRKISSPQRGKLEKSVKIR